MIKKIKDKIINASTAMCGKLKKSKQEQVNGQISD